MSLQIIQSELNAPKNQRNNFGKYSYRSAEDIFEAAKPLLARFQFSLVVSDSLELIGDRYYIKATVSLYNESMKLITHCSAYAREELALKGVQASQITGGTSSYARKYALNGLFLIDDNKDADSQDNTNHQPVELVSKISEQQLKYVNVLIGKKGVQRDMVKTAYEVSTLKDLDSFQTQKLIKQLESKEDIPI